MSGTLYIVSAPSGAGKTRVACVFLRGGHDHLFDAGLGIAEKPGGIRVVVLNRIEDFRLSPGDHFEIANPRCLARHHRQRGVERVELVLVQFVDAALLVGLKLAPAGQIGHLRDLEPVLDDRLRVDNRHALRRRRPRQDRRAQGQCPDHAKRFIRRE